LWNGRGEQVGNLAEFGAHVSDGRMDSIGLGGDRLGFADDGERQQGLRIRLRGG